MTPLNRERFIYDFSYTDADGSIKEILNDDIVTSAAIKVTTFERVLLITELLDSLLSRYNLDFILAKDPRILTNGVVSLNQWNQYQITYKDVTLRLWDLTSVHTIEPGTVLGYPRCCIEHFYGILNGKIKASEYNPFHGTGFVPCPDCADDPEGTQAYISMHRAVNKPFPQDVDLRNLIIAELLSYLGVEYGENIKQYLHNSKDVCYLRLIQEIGDYAK